MQGVLSPVSRRCLLDGARHLWRRRISLKAGGYPQDFVFFPDFLSVQEQRVLLSTSLQKLDKTENRYHRLRRKEYMANNVISNSAASVAQDLFLPDEYYHFEEVRNHSTTEKCFWMMNSCRDIMTVSSEGSVKCM